MSSSRRIILNTVATYGRSIIGTAFGLFSTRWILGALGHTDFGLYGVVGSVIMFITFINGLFGSSITRFYAYAIGRGSAMDSEASRVLLTQWFNSSLLIFTTIPIALVCIGYPIGIYAINHWLTIPLERVEACVWVFRISLATALINMLSVPFISMFTAFQDIVELSLWGMTCTLCTFGSAYLLLFVSGDRLIAYSLFMMIIYAGIPICQCFRAVVKYPACRLNFSYWFDKGRFKELFYFSGWQFFGNCGCLMRNHTCAILTNSYFGPQINAAYSIASTVLAKTGALAQALIGAFAPAITSTEGAGERVVMLELSLRASKMGALLLLFFFIPLILEIDEVLVLWLKDPPKWSNTFCIIAFAEIVLNKMTVGQELAIAAQGRIASFQATLGSVLILSVPLAWCFILMGVGPLSVGFALMLTMVIYSLGRVYWGWRLLRISPIVWLRNVLFPIVFFILIVMLIGCVPKLLMEASFCRVCVTTGFTVIASLVAGWFMVFDKKEKEWVTKIVAMIPFRDFNAEKLDADNRY